MESASTQGTIYRLCLSHATDSAHAELRFWRELLDGLDAGHVAIEDARTLIGTAHIWHRSQRPSRATAYRLIDQWRPVVAKMSDPGRGT